VIDARLSALRARVTGRHDADQVPPARLLHHQRSARIALYDGKHEFVAAVVSRRFALETNGAVNKTRRTSADGFRRTAFNGGFQRFRRPYGLDRGDTLLKRLFQVDAFVVYGKSRGSKKFGFFLFFSKRAFIALHTVWSRKTYLTRTFIENPLNDRATESKSENFLNLKRDNIEMSDFGNNILPCLFIYRCFVLRRNDNDKPTRYVCRRQTFRNCCSHSHSLTLIG